MECRECRRNGSELINDGMHMPSSNGLEVCTLLLTGAAAAGGNISHLRDNHSTTHPVVVVEAGISTKKDNVAC